jgi:twinkle protein
MKDANDMLVAGKGTEVIDAMWRAKEYRPDGIVGGNDLWDYITKIDLQEAVPYPYEGLTKMTHGLRKGELVTITAGSGIGKSQFCRELSHHLLRNGQSVGYIALEESVRRTTLGILGIEMSTPLHLRKDVNEKELKEGFDSCLASGKFFTYDHFGSMDSNNLMNRIRYMAKGCGCGWIILDHLSIVVSGMGDGDERRLIDNTMTKLRSLVEELKVGMIIVSHLKRPEGRGHEEGATTSLSQLRGSAGIAQLSDMVLGLERNQQDDTTRNRTIVRILKNRFTGETGIASYLEYDAQRGRLTDMGEPPVDLPEELQ